MGVYKNRPRNSNRTRPILDLDVLQSGLGVNFSFGSANFRKLPADFSANLGWRNFSAIFSAFFFQDFRPPKEFTPKIHAQNCQHSSLISLSRIQFLFTPSVRGPPVALHVSRYTCRSRCPQNPGVFQVWQQYRATPPLKGPVAPVALELPEVSHVKLPLKRCRATGGCSSYTWGCRAILCKSKTVLRNVFLGRVWNRVREPFPAWKSTVEKALERDFVKRVPS